MLNSIIRMFKGETIFLQTTAPEKYTTGSVILVDVGPNGKALFRVTGTVRNGNSILHAVWGKERATSITGGQRPEAS